MVASSGVKDSGAAPDYRLSLVTIDGAVTVVGELSFGPNPTPAQVGWSLVGTGGASTAIWRRVDSFSYPYCTLVPDADSEFVLVRYDGATPTRLSMTDTPVTSTAARFDGTSYQLFWVTSAMELQHRSLGEDGVLGPLHSIATVTSRACLSAVSDGAGATLVRVSESGDGATYVLAVDPTDGTARRIWDAPARTGCLSDITDVWLAGELRVMACVDANPADMIVYAIDPVASTARVVPLVGESAWIDLLHARDSALFAIADGEMLELAPDYSIVRRFGRAPLAGAVSEPAARLGDGAVYLEHARPMDPVTPHRIEVVRVGEGGQELWRSDVAIDSGTITELCHQPF